MEVKFVNHLIDIGLIDKKTEKLILSLYYQKSNNFKSNKFIFLNKLFFL